MLSPLHKGDVVLTTGKFAGCRRDDARKAAAVQLKTPVGLVRTCQYDSILSGTLSEFDHHAGNSIDGAIWRAIGHDQSPDAECALQEARTPYTALSGGLSAKGQLTRRFCAHVQFKAFGYHDYGLRAVSALPHCEFEGLSSVDKQAAAQTAGVLDDPVSVTVFADQEGRERWAARRRRFTFAHGYIRLLLRQERRLRRQPRGLPLRRICASKADR
jgi:hypothetical protein